MLIPPFDQPGRFYRGNLHMHSTLSDGRVSPQDACRIYRENGYDFVALTDHFLERYNFPVADTRPFRTEGFTTLIGAELHTGQTELGGMWHILAVGLPLDFARTPPQETGPELAARALAAGAFVAAAHPAWYSLTEADILSLGPVHAIEVFNGTSHHHNDRAESWHITHVLLSRGNRYTCCATDDTHFHSYRDDVALGWVQVRATENSPEALLEALKQGHYYSSTGPLIHEIDVEAGRRVRVRCSPAERVYISGKGAEAEYVYGEGIREAELSLSRFKSPYCVVTVRDRAGGRAWSNPIWLAAAEA